MTMHVVHTTEEMGRLRSTLPDTVGLVPTMGYLHEGHLSLVRGSVGENSATVVSVFVNPTQFGKGEDFEEYPRDLDRDLALLDKEGADVVFAPESEQMYPPGFCTWVEVEKITERLEGASRPGHFRGVATVCNKLFNIVQPAVAYFGQKDAQQVIVLRQMIRDLNMGLEVRVLPTVRESDGLAISSRNAYLRGNERRAAAVLFRALTAAQAMHEAGERDASTMRRRMTSIIETEPLASIDYVSVADSESLEELGTVEGAALASVAVRIGRARLIDNVVLS